MRILVTGHEGFLGSTLVKKLEEQKIKPIIFKSDLKNIKDFNEKTDVVIHLASLSPPGGSSGTSGESENNIEITKLLLSYAYKHSKLFIFSSSSGVYGKPQSEIPIKETHALCPLNENGKNKKACEEIITKFALKTGFKSVIFRIFNPYGPGQKEPYLVTHIISRLLKSEEITLRGKHAIRDFIYIDDVCDAMIKCSVKHHNKSENPLILNLGTSVGTTIQNILKICEKITGKKALIKQTSLLETEVPFMVADTQKIMQTLNNWTPKIKLEEGLELTIKDTE